jgi:uncharacterized membrane protein
VGEHVVFAKRLSWFLALLAVPVTLMMVGVITLHVAWSNFGIRGGWSFADILCMICGLIYPVLAITAFRKVRNQADPQSMLRWSLLPIPVLLLFVVLLVKFSGIVR